MYHNKLKLIKLCEKILVNVIKTVFVVLQYVVFKCFSFSIIFFSLRTRRHKKWAYIFWFLWANKCSLKLETNRLRPIENHKKKALKHVLINTINSSTIKPMQDYFVSFNIKKVNIFVLNAKLLTFLTKYVA